MKNTFKPRRLLDDDNPNGYMESDLDYVLNNWGLVMEFLDNHIRYFVLVQKGKPFEHNNLCFIGDAEDYLNDGSAVSEWTNEDFEKFCISNDYTGRIYNIPREREKDFTYEFPDVEEVFAHEFNV
jgi:hypothetical protein